MLELLQTASGLVLLTAYLAVSVALPAGVVVLFVALIGTLIRAGLDAVVPRIPERVRAIPLLARIGRGLRGAFIWAVGTLLFLALVGMSGQVGGPNVFAAGFGQMVVTLAAIQDLVGQWFTGKVLNDLLVELLPTEGVQDPLEPVRRFHEMVALRLFNAIDPGVTFTAFTWTLAAFNTALAAFWVVFEPLRAVRKRVAVLIAPPQQQQVALSSESLERQAEMIAQALARATPQAAPAAAVPATATAAWGRPGIARAPSIAPPAPGAVASQRVAVVTWDGELAAELERQLDGAGFAPLVMRSVAEAFASRVWPAIVFIDARHLQWLSPDRLPLLVRARLVAVTRDDLRVPAGWQLDTHAVETGADALLDLLRRRDSRRKAGSRETGA
jgi:hypothetical protein